MSSGAAGSLVVGPAEALKPGSRTVIQLDNGRSVVIFNVDGVYRALANNCPHQGGPLHRVTGTTRAKITADRFYEPEWIRGGEIVRCGWHQWEFDIVNGNCLADPKLRVATYPVRIVANELLGPEVDDPSGYSVVLDFQ